MISVAMSLRQASKSPRFRFSLVGLNTDSATWKNCGQAVHQQFAWLAQDIHTALVMVDF